MSTRLTSHYSIPAETRRQLLSLKKRTDLPMSRLVVKSIDLYSRIIGAGRPVVCTPTATGIEISEVPQEPNQ